ncbi:MAG: hypothetical protein AB6733_20540 [Clostridiaceae bacterium]
MITRLKNKLNSKIALFSALVVVSSTQVDSLKAMWAAGYYSTSALVSAVSNSIIACLPGGAIAGKKDALIAGIKFILSRGSAAYAGNWYDLCWAFADLAITFVPGFTAAKVFYQVCKLIPVF